MSKYVNVKNIKKIAHDNGKRMSPSFIHSLETYVYEIVEKCAEAHDGGHKTMDDMLFYSVVRKAASK